MMPPGQKSAGVVVPRESLDPVTIRGGGHIVSRIVGDSLEIAQRNVITPLKKLHRAGGFLLREPDYQQVLYWADELQWSPNTVLNKLANIESPPDPFELFTKTTAKRKLRIEDGVIKELVWDGNLMPIKSFWWEPGLQLEKLEIRKKMPQWPTAATLPSLRSLRCISLNLAELDLSPVPRLKRLTCFLNRLSELDLSPVPELTTLRCGSNQLTELDLSFVKELTDLRCSNNQLAQLDLLHVPKLTNLWCSGNQLAQLDLSPVPKLTDLRCSNNQLAQIDLSFVPEITNLMCFMNQLTELDLSYVPKLRKLWCSWNLLRELALSSAQELSELRCSKNQLTELDLRYLKCSDINPICDEGVRIIRG